MDENKLSKIEYEQLLKESESKLNEAYGKLKEMRHQLVQAEKLNAIGQLASGIAHEIRNPLAIITQGVEYLEKKFPLKDTEDSSEVLTMVKENIKRAAKIVSSLLDFSKKTTLNLQPEDVNSILEESLVLVKTQLKSTNITIIMETKVGLPKILADKNRLEQVFVNILLNAIQAMPKGGKITIRSYKEVLQKFKDGIGRREGDVFNIGEEVVIVEIEDTGIGISEENLKRIFEPFFTTDPHRGSGLGLSVSRSIIGMHKGLIELVSQVGKGTKITLSLKAAGK